MDAMQWLAQMIEEDRNRVLTPEQEEETLELMRVIDDHRERKLFQPELADTIASSCNNGATCL